MKTCSRLNNYKYFLSLRSRKKRFYGSLSFSLKSVFLFLVEAVFLLRSEAPFFCPAFGGKCGFRFRASDRPDGRSVLRRSEVRTAVARSFRTASPTAKYCENMKQFPLSGKTSEFIPILQKSLHFLCMVHKRFNCKKSFTTAHLAFASRFSALFSHILSRSCKVCITGDKKRN